MVGRRAGATFAAVALAAAWVRCSSFDATTGPTPTPPGGPDAPLSVPEAAPEAGEPGVYVRTGPACISDRIRCDAGESCCRNAGGYITCAVDCVEADASFIITECSRPGDCPEGFDCCAITNGGCGGGYYSGAKCLPKGTCSLCGDGGGSVLACDRFGHDCPANRTCSEPVGAGSPYYGCTY